MINYGKSKIVISNIDFQVGFDNTGDLNLKYLALILFTFILLLILNKFEVKKLLPYLILGLFLWRSFLSGLSRVLVLRSRHRSRWSLTCDARRRPV